MIDISIAINCINIMKKEGHYRGQKIGRIIKGEDCKGLTSRISGIPGRKKGQIVLFTEDLSPSDAELCMGEYRGMEQKPTGTVTIESPMTQEEINRQRARESYFTTTGTMINVPIEYLEEIKV